MSHIPPSTPKPTITILYLHSLDKYTPPPQLSENKIHSTYSLLIKKRIAATNAKLANAKPVDEGDLDDALLALGHDSSDDEEPSHNDVSVDEKRGYVSRYFRKRWEHDDIEFNRDLRQVFLEGRRDHRIFEAQREEEDVEQFDWID